MHLEKVNVKVEANDVGQSGGKLISPGEKFNFKGNLKNGKFPKWVIAPKGFKSKFSQLSEKEQEKFLGDKGKKSSVDEKALRKKIESELRGSIESELEEKIKADLEAKIRAEIEMEIASEDENPREDQKPEDSAPESNNIV